MDAPTIPVFVDSSEGNFGDAPAATDAFPTGTIIVILASLGEAILGIHEYLQRVPVEEDMSTLMFRMSMIEAENASLCGKIRTIEAIEMVTCSQERRTRREVEQQLASIQKSQRQDRENFRNLQELAMIEQGVTAALAARDAYRNGDDIHTSGKRAGRESESVVRDCTSKTLYSAKPIFKATELAYCELDVSEAFDKIDGSRRNARHDPWEYCDSKPKPMMRLWKWPLN
ncbi:hypothetical protein Tco_0389860 [Tanacetum coccineum]